MSRTETAGNLITRAKERSDMENSDFISTAEWYRSLNVHTAKLWNKLVAIDPDRYTKEETFTASGTTTDFVPATDYFGTAGVDYISDLSQGIYVPLERLFGEDEHRLQQSVAGIPVGYTFRYNTTTVLGGPPAVAAPEAQLIRILPPPDRDCRHRYIVAPPSYATDGTDSGILVIGIAGFEEYVVIGMAIDARIKEESSVVQLRQSQALFDKELDEAAELRSVDSAGHVHDSRKPGYGIDAASIRWGGRYF